MKKRLVSIFLALAMCMGLAVPAVAAEPEMERIENALLQQGYPQVYLDNISETVKESLFQKPDLEFAGATVATYCEATGEITCYDISEDGIMPYGQIPSSDLTLTWAIGRYSNGNVLVSYSYTWNNPPVFRFQDPIGVSWDSSCFEMKDDSFYKVDKLKGFPNYGEGGLGPIETVTNSEAHSYANGSPSGVTWYADLPLNGAYLVDSLCGHGEFELIPKKTNFSTVFYGHYVHNKLSVGLSMSVPGFGSFSVSGGGSYDELGNQRTYTYR